MLWRCPGIVPSQITRAKGQSHKICKEVFSTPRQFRQEGSVVNPRLNMLLLLMIRSCPASHKKKRTHWGTKAFQIYAQIGSCAPCIWARMILIEDFKEKLPSCDPIQDHWFLSLAFGKSSTEEITLITFCGRSVVNFSLFYPLLLFQSSTTMASSTSCGMAKIAQWFGQGPIVELEQRSSAIAHFCLISFFEVMSIF